MSERGHQPHVAESALLACLLESTESAVAARAVVLARCDKSGMFTSPQRMEIYRHLVRWHTRTPDKKVDLILLADAMAKDSVHAQVGYVDLQPYVAGTLIGSPEEYREYLDIVYQAYVARRLSSGAAGLGTGVAQKGQVMAEDLEKFKHLLHETEELQSRGQKTPSRLKRPKEFEELLWEEFYYSGQRHEPGAEMPIPYPVKIRRKEASLVRGTDGVGKSTWVRWLQPHLQRQEEFLTPDGDFRPIVVGAFEEPKERIVSSMAFQLIGRKKFDTDNEKGNLEQDKALYQQALDYLDPRLFVYDFTGIAQWRDVLDTFYYAGEKLGAGLFVFDSLMRAGIAADDYSQQGLAVTAMSQFTKDTNSHIFILAHENKEGGTAGSKGIENNIDNNFRVSINKTKADQLATLEADIATMQASVEARLEEYTYADVERKQAQIKDFMAQEWDTELRHNKQRFPGSQQNGCRRFWFSRSSLQYRKASSENFAINYLAKWEGDPEI